MEYYDNNKGPPAIQNVRVMRNASFLNIHLLGTCGKY